MKRVYAREDVCMGCKLCEIHCLVQHSETKNIIWAFKRENPKPVSRLRVEIEGPLSFALQCRHCEEPACAEACITGAMQIDDRGVVRVDTQKCIGCWTCVLACPFGAVIRDEVNHVSVKCDLCPDLSEPACVTNCPNRALLYREEGEAV